jgi:hypothetical protein
MLKRLRKGIGGGLSWEFSEDGKELEALVQGTEDLSGADIEVIVRHALDYTHADEENEEDEIVIRYPALAKAVQDFIPSSKKREIARMTLGAIKACNRHEYQPDNVEEIKRRAQAILDQAASDSVDEQQVRVMPMLVPIPVHAQSEESNVVVSMPKTKMGGTGGTN